jgi:hypothetical protein
MKSKFAHKKGTFDLNIVFTAILACTKRALFITKKGTLNKFFFGGGGAGGGGGGGGGGGNMLPCSYAPKLYR